MASYHNRTLFVFVEGVRLRGRPKITWNEIIELCKEGDVDHRKWRKLIKYVV